MDLHIDPEFKNLIPPLTDEEYQQLTDNLIKEGCRDALIIWDGTIIDGHNRYEICKFHNIEFRTEERQFSNRDEAKEWIIRNQFGRRNLSIYDRSRLALQLESLIKEKAKKNQRNAGGDRGNQFTGGKVAVIPKSDKPAKHITTDKELGKIAGVAHDTITKVRIIEKEATPEQKSKLSKGELKVNTVYRELRPKKEDKPVEKTPDEQEVEKKEKSESWHDSEEATKALISIINIPYFEQSVNRFLGEVSTYQFCSESFKKISQAERERLVRNVMEVDSWLNGMKKMFKEMQFDVKF